MPRLPIPAAVWFAVLAAWFLILWTLSSNHAPGPPLPVPHLDKAAHFAYFLCGGFLYAGWHRKLRPQAAHWHKTLGFAIVTMALIGALDEWHQCHTPGRHGGDLWDWLADLLGGTTGAIILKTIHRHVK
jgi:VanZ family protein